MTITKPFRIRRILKWAGVGVCIVFALVGFASCTTVLEYHNGDGGCVVLGGATLYYRGGVTSPDSLSYTLVPLQTPQVVFPKPIAVDVTLMRKLHVFPPKGWRMKYSFNPSMGKTRWWRREFCGAFFPCKRTGVQQTSGFWMQEIFVATWLPFVLAALLTLSAWRREIYNRLSTRIPPGHCQACGYNLTGNVSGRCPECGEACKPEAGAQ